MNNFLSLIVISLFSIAAFCHGEDKPGPHGGFIRMPGAFHIEVIPVKKNTLKVYLLDLRWKNPTVENSSLVVSLNREKFQKAKCEITKNQFYFCSFSKKIKFNEFGRLIIKAKRDGQMGNEVYFDLPLKLKVVDDGHGGHH